MWRPWEHWSAGWDQRPDVLPNDPEIEVITYVSRGFEEYRGFPQAMQAIALLQQDAPIFTS